MSRVPSHFWRSHRNSNSHQQQGHRRGGSIGDTLLPPGHSSSSHGSASMPLQRSRSSDRSSSVVGQSITMRGMERLEQRRIVEERNFLQTKARSQNWNPPVDLRMLDYLTEFDENLMCPICRCPFVDPVVLNECDHCFCRDCIRQTWTTTSAYNPLGPRGDCPTCRTPAKLGPRSATNKILINILDDLIVKCPKTDDGCGVQVKRGEVQDHMSIYCGFALIECPADGCELPVERKDSNQGCLHHPVSCIACHEEMQKSSLEAHWRAKCPDRLIACELCKTQLYSRQLAEHKQRQCTSISVKCPGHELGCTVRSPKSQTDIHATSCTFAKLAPVLSAQKQRMDEQEAAQKQMSRKLDVLETGFANMHNIMFPSADNPDATSADPSSIPLLHGYGSDDPEALPVTDVVPVALAPSAMPAVGFETETDLRQNHSHRTTNEEANAESSTAFASVPVAPGPRPTDIPGPYSVDFDLTSPFPPPATNGGPYASPLHHLLSMHESLRDELGRVNAALQELDGRHSMQILNENMRTREEITYLGAQIAGLSRQVHWLTSEQLQRSATGAPGTRGAAGDSVAGPSVEAAITSAVRGAARIVSAGREGMSMRRGPSEEGRTKL